MHGKHEESFLVDCRPWPHALWRKKTGTPSKGEDDSAVGFWRLLCAADAFHSSHQATLRMLSLPLLLEKKVSSSFCVSRNIARWICFIVIFLVKWWTCFRSLSSDVSWCHWEFSSGVPSTKFSWRADLFQATHRCIGFHKCPVSDSPSGSVSAISW